MGRATPPLSPQEAVGLHLGAKEAQRRLTDFRHGGARCGCWSAERWTAGSMGSDTRIQRRKPWKIQELDSVNMCESCTLKDTYRDHGFLFPRPLQLPSVCPSTVAIQIRSRLVRRSEGSR